MFSEILAATRATTNGGIEPDRTGEEDPDGTKSGEEGTSTPVSSCLIKSWSMITGATAVAVDS